MAAASLWALSALCLSLIVFEQLHTLAYRAPTLRAVIETGIALCALAVTWLFAQSFGHHRRLRDLILVGALLGLAAIDFVSYVLPAAMSLRSAELLIGPPLLGTLLMGAAVLVAAITPPEKTVAAGYKPLAIAIAGGLLGAAVAELGGLALGRDLAVNRSIPGDGLAMALGHPVGVVLVVATTAVVGVAATAMAGADRGTGVSMLIAAGMVLFGAARLNYLFLPAPGIAWVTASEGLRLVGYALVLAAAMRQEAAIRRAIAESATNEERRRIARDLHDGLAQDLAFIVAHGDRIASEAGADHPLAIAARRALAVSRGAIADLSAADATSATTALCQVAAELEVRFGVRITVQAEESELSGSAREDVVRIVREAIVNAAKGRARNIVVTLARTRDRFVVRVLDDGDGIGSGGVGSRPGFGLRLMGERAAALGGRLIAREAADGGTELELTFP